MEKSADQYHQAPEWLTAEYLEPVLRNYFKDVSLHVKDVHCQPATAKGENYASIVTRFHVTYTIDNDDGGGEHNTSFLVKTMHESDPFVSELMAPYKLFDTEMEMYERVLPQLTELLRKIGDNDKLFANTMHVDYEHEAIMFEDLSPLNYVNADRIAGVDLQLAKLAIYKLAKMHATASVLNERTGGSLEHFDRGIFNRHTRGTGPYFEHILGVCADFAGDCVELGPYYKEKLLKLQSHVVEYAESVQDVRKNEFNTLNHGDFWTNNVMLRYNEESPNTNGSTEGRTVKDLLIIDFQFCAWGTPAVDLHYFFQTSLPIEIIKYNEDELVQYYHQVLAHTLRQLQYQGHIPTLHELIIQLEVGRFHAVAMVLGARALLTNDNPEDASYQTMLLDDEAGRRFRKGLYERKPQQELMKYLLPYFDRRGLLDVVD